MESDGIDLVRGLLPGVDPAAGQRIPGGLVPKLPTDTVAAGTVPAGLRLAVTGTATALRLNVRLKQATPVPSPMSGDGFAVWLGGELVSRVPLAGEVMEIPLPDRDADEVVEIHLPENRWVVVSDATAVGGELRPSPAGPRWVAYGDSITQGWSTSAPGGAWPSIAARHLGLDVVNFGFAGSARGELLTAVALAESQADIVTLAWGTNAWSSVPTDVRQIAETHRLFLTTVRQGLPDVPVVVVSPIVRPDAEATPNRFGATLADLREGIEEATQRFVDESGDKRISLLSGEDLVPADELVDGVHPGDAGHVIFATGVAAVMSAALASAGSSD